MIFGERSPFAPQLVDPSAPTKPEVLATSARTASRVGMLPPFALIARWMAAIRILPQSYAGMEYAPKSSLFGNAFLKPLMIDADAGICSALGAATAA